MMTEFSFRSWTSPSRAFCFINRSIRQLPPVLQHLSDWLMTHHPQGQRSKVIGRCLSPHCMPPVCLKASTWFHVCVYLCACVYQSIHMQNEQVVGHWGCVLVCVCSMYSFWYKIYWAILLSIPYVGSFFLRKLSNWNVSDLTSKQPPLDRFLKTLMLASLS